MSHLYSTSFFLSLIWCLNYPQCNVFTRWHAASSGATNDFKSTLWPVKPPLYVKLVELPFNRLLKCHIPLCYCLLIWSLVWLLSQKQLETERCCDQQDRLWVLQTRITLQTDTTRWPKTDHRTVRYLKNNVHGDVEDEPPDSTSACVCKQQTVLVP